MTISQVNTEVNKEGSGMRLILTNEEVLSILERYKREIPKVILKPRYKLWLSYCVLTIMALLLIYISTFAHLYDTSGQESPLSEKTKQKIVFLFFWTGVYSDNDNVDYLATVYPFYLLLILLILERLA